MTAPQRDWRPTGDRQNSPAKGHRWAIAVGAVLLALLGGLLGWLTLIRPQPPLPEFVSLALDEYPASVPVPPWTRQDGEVLAALGWPNQAQTTSSQQRTLLVAQLASLEPAHKDRPLVVFLSGYAVVRPDGVVCLLPIDRLDRPNDWLPLRDVLDSLVTCPAKQKLLIVDVMRPLWLPERGILRQDVTAKVWPLLERAVSADRNLSILTACSPGQQSHSSEALGHSVFGYFLWRGLLGEARDSWTGKRVGSRVTVPMLEAYLARQADQWAWANLSVRQTPRLLGTADYPLTDPPAKMPEEELSLSTYPTWLTAGWNLRDDWWKEHVHWYARPLMRELESALMRAEQRWRAGQDPERVRSDLDGLLRQLRERKPAVLAEDTGGSSLAKTLARKPDPSAQPTEKAIADLRELLVRRDELRGVKPDDPTLKTVLGEAAELAKQHKGRPVALALLACETLSNHPIGSDGMALLVEVLESGGADSFDEVRFLARLAKRGSQKPDYWSGESAQLALQTAREAAHADTFPARARPWAEEARQHADKLAVEGERLLFQVDQPWDKKTQEQFSSALRQYRVVTHDLHIAEQAQRCRDESLIWLPGFLDALGIQPENAPAWQQAAEMTLQLRQALEPVPPENERRNRLEQLGTLTESLRKDPKSMHKLREKLAENPFAALLKPRSTPRAADCKECRVLLATPWLDAKSRVKLWDAYVLMAQACHAESVATRANPATLPSWDERAVKQAEAGQNRLDLDRAGWMVQSLRLETTAENAKLQSALDELRRRPDDSAGWKRLAAEFARLRPPETP